MLPSLWKGISLGNMQKITTELPLGFVTLTHGSLWLAKSSALVLRKTQRWYISLSHRFIARKATIKPAAFTTAPHITASLQDLATREVKVEPGVLFKLKQLSPLSGNPVRRPNIQRPSWAGACEKANLTNMLKCRKPSSRDRIRVTENWYGAPLRNPRCPYIKVERVFFRQKPFYAYVSHKKMLSNFCSNTGIYINKKPLCLRLKWKCTLRVGLVKSSRRWSMDINKFSLLN